MWLVGHGFGPRQADQSHALWSITTVQGRLQANPLFEELARAGRDARQGGYTPKQAPVRHGEGEFR